MYFQKIRHPSNFRFATGHAGDSLGLGDAAPLRAHVRDLGEDVFHVELRDDARWPLDPRLLRMHDDAFAGTSTHRLGFDADGTLRLEAAQGGHALAGIRVDGRGVGGLGASAGCPGFFTHALDRKGRWVEGGPDRRSLGRPRDRIIELLGMPPPKGRGHPAAPP